MELTPCPIRHGDMNSQPMSVREKASPTVEMKRASLAYCVSNCMLFSGLPREDVEAVAALAVVQNVNKGDYVFRQGDPCHGFFVVQRGSINLHRVVADGREKVIYIFRENESFAEGAMTMAGGYPVDARAEEPSQVLMIGKQEFLGLLRQRPELALRMMASLAQHNRLLLAQIEDLTSKDVESRLAGWLLKRCPQPFDGDPVCIELTITKRVLAAELGTVGETLSRALGKLRALSLVEPQDRKLLVSSPQGLDAFLRNRMIPRA